MYALNSITCVRIVLQWIPSYCGVTTMKKKPDELAKEGD